MRKRRKSAAAMKKEGLALLDFTMGKQGKKE